MKICLLCVLLLSAALLPAWALTPDAIVLPPEAGQKLGTVATQVPGLYLVISSPLKDVPGWDEFNARMQTVNIDEDSPLLTDPFLQVPIQSVASLWLISPTNYRLIAGYKVGPLDGILVRSPLVNSSNTFAQNYLSAWKVALMNWIWNNYDPENSAVATEIAYYTELTDDAEVMQAWDEHYCTPIDFANCQLKPGQSSCRVCCNDAGSLGNAGCWFAGGLTYVGGCLIGEACGPAAPACCAVAKGAGWLIKRACQENIRQQKNACLGGCSSLP